MTLQRFRYHGRTASNYKLGGKRASYCSGAYRYLTGTPESVWQEDVPVPLTSQDDLYDLPIPKAKFFGSAKFVLALSNYGSINKLGYATTGASDAADAAGSLGSAIGGSLKKSTQAEQASEVQAQADLIYQQQRLLQCRPTPQSNRQVTLVAGHTAVIVSVIALVAVATARAQTAPAPETTHRPFTGTLADLAPDKSQLREQAHRAKEQALEDLKVLAGPAAARVGRLRALSTPQFLEQMAIAPPVGPSAIATPKAGTTAPSPSVNFVEKGGGATVGHPGVALLFGQARWDGHL